MKILSATVVASLSLALLAPLAIADDHVDFGKARPRRTALVTAEPMATESGLAPMPEPGPERATTIFGLPKNIGPVDRVGRTVVGLGLAGAGIYGLTSGDWSDTTSGVLLGVSAVPFATVATGYCPLYQLVGIDRSF